ncbi:hypothetical protein OOZ19_13565 [Saccharopolyspora sp. NFXS83]|uniref:hypothetical protein n=1 Tax=Saccharopolyspora sp. NFXS83 TaxID=2993560 RepID=UPI00224ABB3E|nr:hypothetical protein [Saccharopolyspora sp. NFXS83]MCX2731272.1 hypothetical protein [Saccharopolyspora sp. NFXS83]
MHAGGEDPGERRAAVRVARPAGECLGAVDETYELAGELAAADGDHRLAYPAYEQVMREEPLEVVDRRFGHRRQQREPVAAEHPLSSRPVRRSPARQGHAGALLRVGLTVHRFSTNRQAAPPVCGFLAGKPSRTAESGARFARGFR